jgi:hypothetical protein
VAAREGVADARARLQIHRGLYLRRDLRGSRSIGLEAGEVVELHPRDVAELTEDASVPRARQHLAEEIVGHAIGGAEHTVGGHSL